MLFCKHVHTALQPCYFTLLNNTTKCALDLHLTRCHVLLQLKLQTELMCLHTDTIQNEKKTKAQK